MSRTDKAALKKGALAIRKAERDAVTLDGTINAPTSKIVTLHNKITSTFKTAYPTPLN